MAISTKITGMNGILNNLNKATSNMQSNSQDATYKSALLLEEKSNNNAPKVSGKLIDSSYVVTNSDGSSTVGYGVDYAYIVHELPTSTGWKFLRRAMDSNHSEILNIMKQELEI